MSDFYEDDETACPKCGHCPTRYRDCDVINCEDGWIDLYEEDPTWADEDDEAMCFECHGTGIQRWCPKCGADVNWPVRETRDETH